MPLTVLLVPHSLAAVKHRSNSTHVPKLIISKVVDTRNEQKILIQRIGEVSAPLPSPPLIAVPGPGPPSSRAIALIFSLMDLESSTHTFLITIECYTNWKPLFFWDFQKNVIFLHFGKLHYQYGPSLSCYLLWQTSVLIPLVGEDEKLSRRQALDSLWRHSKTIEIFYQTKLTTSAISMSGVQNPLFFIWSTIFLMHTFSTTTRFRLWMSSKINRAPNNGLSIHFHNISR